MASQEFELIGGNAYGHLALAPHVQGLDPVPTVRSRRGRRLLSTLLQPYRADGSRNT